MNLKLKLKLQEKIEEWSIENCEDTEIWPMDAFFGYKTDEAMANAASAVFDGIVNIQKYLKQQNLLEE